MTEMLSYIKDLARKVSEDYLLLGKGMNESLSSLMNDGEIENEEILRRVSEQSNQNVYLALFHDEDTDKSNIVFDVADFKKVSRTIKESEKAMKDYDTPPEDFRKSTMNVEATKTASPKGDMQKLSELGVAVAYRDRLNNLLNKVGILKTAEMQNADRSFNEMAHDAKLMISKGESIGDICKIACRHVRENLDGGLENQGLSKIAECYDVIKKDLTDNNFKVKTGFTKISSQNINKESDMLKPVEEFSMSLVKISGFRDMEDGIRNQLNVFSEVIKENQQ